MTNDTARAIQIINNVLNDNDFLPFEYNFHHVKNFINSQYYNEIIESKNYNHLLRGYVETMGLSFAMKVHEINLDTINEGNTPFIEYIQWEEKIKEK